MILAGHGKDPRLVQIELPVVEIIEGDENYTPEYFLAPCKEFLGAIDLDPFSCEIANQTIKAVNIFTREDDALNQDWSSFNRKWVNPPYSAGLIGKAIAKTLEYSGIGETLLLVNTSSSAKWFQSCMEKCAAYLHPSKRINFNSPYRTSKGNRYDQTLFYFGDRPLEFAEALASLGQAVQPIRKSVLVRNNCIDNSLLKEGDRVMIDGDSSNTAEFYTLYPSMPSMACVVRSNQDTEDIELNRLTRIGADKLPVFANAIALEPTQSVANLRMDEGSVSVVVGVDDRYQFLLEQREKLINSGASPSGVWINCGKVPHRDFKQAVWKSDKPQPQWGDKKSHYIGRFMGDEHLSAIAQHKAGQKLRAVEREIRKLQVKS